jgi:hypothetical protein
VKAKFIRQNLMDVSILLEDYIKMDMDKRHAFIALCTSYGSKQTKKYDVIPCNVVKFMVNCVTGRS